ncbi:hypothetical protein FKW77_002762 [Venturia effusa]|uniref:PUM-HD domain-containing protein n=1 Tax=Venturia effusa TaxID=50376 RepID=A0A517LME8_9PEZI|nr:hypothetical protein FKW77_002762 [Venturia effusa]
MARPDKEDMTKRSAVLPALYSNGTNSGGTNQNSTHYRASTKSTNSKSVASIGFEALATQNDAAVAQNGMNGFAMSRPTMNDRFMRASDESRTPGSNSPWMNSWASSRSATRESSQTREIPSLGSRANNESKTGSMIALSDPDIWNDVPASSQPPARSVRTSPVRRDSIYSVQDVSSSSSTSQNMFFGARKVYQRPTNGSFDYQEKQHTDGSADMFRHQARLSDDNSQFRGLTNAWNNPPPALQSPTDGYNGKTSSFAPSQNGSREFNLPPSRNGNDYQITELGRFGSPSTLSRSRSDHTAISTPTNGFGKSPLEQNGLQQHDLAGQFTDMSISNSRNGLHHGNSYGNTLTSERSHSHPPRILAYGHDESPLDNGARHVQSDTPNVLQASFRQRQPDSRFGQSVPNSSSLPGLLQDSSPRAGPTYQGYQDPPTIAALTLQLQQQQQQQMQLQQQQMMLLHQHQRYRGPYAPHQPSRMNPQQQYQYSTIPMQTGLVAPAAIPPQSTLASTYLHGSNESTEITRISTKLAEFKEMNKNKHTDIFDHVVEFSGDQNGSRFIQSRLETANSDEKERLVQEILPEVVQLSMDVFGNYVVQMLFKHCDQAQKRALANKLKGHMYSLSIGQYACRVVQDALSHILSNQQHELAKELEPHLERLAKNVNANHVLQVSIQVLDAQWVQTVLAAFHHKIYSLARDQYGCRVIQRLLENCDESAQRRIFEELHPHIVVIIGDNYGNYVAQNMMKFGNAEDRNKIIAAVKGCLLDFAKNKYASNVVEKCLTYGSSEGRRELMEVAIQNPDHLCQLIQDPFGNYVVQQFLLILEGDDRRKFVANVQPQLLKAKEIGSGKQIAAVEKLMHTDCTAERQMHKSATSSTSDTKPADAAIHSNPS